MSWMNAPTYDIERLTGQCAITGQALNPGEQYIAALVEADPSTTEAPADNTPKQTAAPNAGLKRIDISIEAWQQGHRPERLFSHWQSTVPQPNEKKKMFVDDSVLMNLLLRLADTDQPQRLAFRFVLTLILMRKKLLRYEGAQKRNDTEGQPQEWWTVTPKRGLGVDEEPIEILNPQINDEQIQQVTEQLGQILESEL